MPVWGVTVPWGPHWGGGSPRRPVPQGHKLSPKLHCGASPGATLAVPIPVAMAGAMEVVLVWMCRAFNPDNRTVFFEGKYAGAELFRSLGRAWDNGTLGTWRRLVMGLLTRVPTGCPELIGSIFDFAQNLCALRFSEGEVALFSAIVLVNAGEGHATPVPPVPPWGVPKRPKFYPRVGAGWWGWVFPSCATISGAIQWMSPLTAPCPVPRAVPFLSRCPHCSTHPMILSPSPALHQPHPVLVPILGHLCPHPVLIPIHVPPIPVPIHSPHLRPYPSLPMSPSCPHPHPSPTSRAVSMSPARPWLQDPGKVARLQGRLEVAFRLLLRRTQREGLLARVGTQGGHSG